MLNMSVKRFISNMKRSHTLMINAPRGFKAISSRHFSDIPDDFRKRRSIPRKRQTHVPRTRTMAAKQTQMNIPPPSAPPPASIDAWQEVTDKETGQKYWWNTKTDKTTALGAPKPQQQTSTVEPQQQQQQQGGMIGGGGIGSTIAEGFAFGVGSSIARNVVGSMFGGFGGGDDTGAGVESGSDYQDSSSTADSGDSGYSNDNWGGFDDSSSSGSNDDWGGFDD
jgi:hypothetical protein